MIRTNNIIVAIACVLGLVVCIRQAAEGGWLYAAWANASRLAGYEAQGKAAWDEEDRDVQEHVLFAYTQLPPDKGVPALLHVARTHKEAEMRKRAIFWLSQTADAHVADALAHLARTERDADVQQHVAFAFAQMPADLGVPRLIDMAEHHPHREVRKQAIFWLSQVRDPRAAGALLGQFKH